MESAAGAPAPPQPSRNGIGPQPLARGERLAHNVEEIARLEQRDQLKMSRSDRIANHLAGFSGSMVFVWIHVVLFSAWIIVNSGVFPGRAFDPFPYGLLTVVVSLEAIFLSTFVLISQNRQAALADRRAKVDLQVNMIAEQEITKVIQMVTELSEHLGVTLRDPELRAMARPTDVKRVMDAIDNAEKDVDPKGAAGPTSASDTEA